jgi:hypothetical protein
MFVFVGASNGCIPAAFFAKQFAEKTLSVTFLSCVPGQLQWADMSRMQCPVTVTCGRKEEFFGGAASIYSFAQTVHANVFSFWGKHLFEGQEVLRRLAYFVADASKPSEAAPASPRRSPRRSKSKSPSKTRKSPPRRRRAGQRGVSKTNQRKRSRSEDSRRAGGGAKSASPKRG